jgi:hypothetical protein
MNTEWLKQANRPGQQLLMALADAEKRTGIQFLDKDLSYRYNREGFAGLDKRQLDALDRAAERLDFVRTAHWMLNTDPRPTDADEP